MLLHRALAAALLTLAIGGPTAADATPCQLCDSATMCSSTDEVCASGLPETGTSGRCAPLCPNPNATHGGCANNYTCLPFQDGSRRCVPRSEDCTNLTNFTERQVGQSCSSQSCVWGALCLDSVCTVLCSGFGAPGCASGEFCGYLGSPASGLFACGQPIGEAATCGAGAVCSVGFCLNDGTTTQCYRNCGSAAGSSACQSSQTCESIELSGGDFIDICMPPQQSSPRDAGVTPDAGFVFPDAFVPSNPDASGPSNPDAFVRPNDDASTRPNEDASQPRPGEDARTNPIGEDPSVPSESRDASVVRPAPGNGGGGGTLRRNSDCATTGASTPLALLAVLGLMAIRRRAR